MTTKTDTKVNNRDRRHARVRAKISGTAERPRLAVFRSNKYITGQLINDVTGKTLASATSKTAAGKTFSERAFAAGQALAVEAKKAKISTIVFDRGGFLYTGRVKAFADGARDGGLVF